MLATSALALAALVQGAKSFDLRVQGEERHTIAYHGLRAQSAPCPLVLVFHAHGSSANSASRTFRIHKEWPEATVAYLQGLPAPGVRDPDGTRAGWQTHFDDQFDRDFRYFDAVLEHLAATTRVDPSRVFVVGFDSGGRMALLLWAGRGERIAGVAAGSCRVTPRDLQARLEPRPLLFFAGRKDPVVPFAEARAELDALLGANLSDPEGRRERDVEVHRALPGGAPTWWLAHDDAHVWPKNATAAIIRFFKSHP